MLEMKQKEQELNEKIRILTKSYWALRQQVAQMDNIIRDLRLSLIKYEGEKNNEKGK